MSFFATGKSVSRVRGGTPSLELLHRQECNVCPLATCKNKNPNIPAAGSSQPLIYVLGEAPGKDEDDNRSHFTGKAGKLLRYMIPRDFINDIRWNNVVRTRPPENRTPVFTEIECCRPSVVRDIEKTKPKAIFGLGAIPLEWVSGQIGINSWRGRRFPVTIGEHTCWFYSFHHPAFITRTRDEAEAQRKRELRLDDIGSEEDRMFRLDLDAAFAEIDDLPPARVVTPQEAMAGVDWVLNCDRAGLDRIKQHLRWAATLPAAGVDYETNGKRPYRRAARVLTAAVAGPGKSLAFPFDHPQARWDAALRQELQEAWIEFLNAPGVYKVVHNVPFEMEWTATLFDERCLLHSNWDDTMSQAFVLDERTGRGEGQRKDEQGPLSLDFLVRQYFGLALKKMSPMDKGNLANEPLEDVLRYNGLDSKFHLMLGDAQHARLAKEGRLDLYEADLAQLAPLTRMQLKGLPVDQERVEELSAKYAADLKRLEEKIHKYPQAEEFKRMKKMALNPNNNQDVTILVRDIMRRKEGERGGGNYGVDEDVLLEIEHPLTNDILQYRKVHKVKSTYNDGIRVGGAFLHEDGKLHPQINTTVARTGRTSAEDPNNQNWPKRDEGQKEVRSQIAAPPEHVILSVDYGQIQARNIAMESKDKAFVKALWERYDVHMEWAERLSRAYPQRVGGKQNFTDKKVMKDFRQDVKNKWTFPLFFGSQDKSVAEALGIPLNVIKPEYDSFWRIFSGVRDWQDRTIRFYKKHGYVEALDGRRRHGPLSTNQVINSPIQADEACIVKDALARVVRKSDNWDTQPIMLIHDDLTFIVPTDGLEKRLEFIVDCMLDLRHFSWINVPITVEVSTGSDWEHMEEIAAFSSDEWFK